MSTVSNSENPSGVFLWARSGGGHRTAKDGIKQQKIKEYAAQGKQLDTKTDIDITGEKVLSSVRVPFVGGLGDIGVRSWDNAQKKGDLKFLENYASWGWIGEIIFYPLVYFRMKWLLQDLKVEPEFVVSTQAFCLNAIMQAMRTVNKQKSWNMHMHVYLTDMPSKKAIHFFPSIRKVAGNSALRDMVTLHAPPPITKKGQTDKEFWERYCGKIKVITNEKFPIRQAFLETTELKEKLLQPSVDVNIKLNNTSEADIIKKGLSENRAAQFNDVHATLNIKNEDKVAFLMLGSMPTTKSVLEWVNSFVDESKKPSINQNYFFLYCGAPDTAQEQNALLHAVSHEIDKLKQDGKIAPNFNIIPFTNQSADEIALLMARSDVSITRSGGATSMELVELDRADLPKRANKLVLINSEAELTHPKPPIPDSQEFAKAIKADVARHMADKRLLSSPEFKAIKHQMIQHAVLLGYSKEKARALVHNILEHYVYSNNGVPKQSFEELIKEMNEHAKMLSNETAPARKLIEAQMKKMQAKDDYKALDLCALRKLAIERVLTKKGIVLWEGGNAEYLAKTIGAHVTTPQYAKSLLRDSFF